jgi:hypothetical protein
MRKFYFITATGGHLNDRHEVIRTDHAFRNINGGSSATDTQIQDIKTKFADFQVGPSAVIFLRRADVRDAVVKMNVQNLGGYTYSVREVGEFKRTVRPVLGYRFKRGDGRGEWYNEFFQGPASNAAERAKVNRLIPTRALARAALPEQQKSADDHTDCTGKKIKLSIETVYADA